MHDARARTHTWRSLTTADSSSAIAESIRSTAGKKSPISLAWLGRVPELTTSRRLIEIHMKSPVTWSLPRHVRNATVRRFPGL